jgi:Na+/alanine symporter
MQNLNDFISALNGIVWGPLMLILILGTGLYLMYGLAFMPLRRIGYSFKLLWQGRVEKGEGDIAPFNALMVSLRLYFSADRAPCSGCGVPHWSAWQQNMLKQCWR